MTATAATRKRRGADTQRIVAAWFAGRGWPYAESTGAGRSGSDITGMPGLACEVKARRDFSPLAWIRQAALNRGLPFCVHRPDGMGEASVGDWPVTLRLTDLTDLLRSAGFGDPDPGGNLWTGKPCRHCTGDSAVRKADGSLMPSRELCADVGRCTATVDWEAISNV